MSNQLIPKLKSGLDEKIAEQFAMLFNDAQNGLRRVVAFGLFAWQIKLEELKHGQFGPWVQNYFGDKISYRSVRAHMHLTESALTAVGIKSVKAYLKLAAPLPFSHAGELLLVEDKKVPEAAKPLREKLCALIDGKSARALFTEFKQAEDSDEDKPLQKKRGRLKGQGGASAEQRAAAKEAEERAEIEAMELDAQDFDKWIDKVSDAKGLPRISEKVWNKHLERVEFHLKWMRSINDGRKGGTK